MKIEMTKIDLKTGTRKYYTADVSQVPDDTHRIYTLTYEGYRTDWKEKK